MERAALLCAALALAACSKSSTDAVADDAAASATTGLNIAAGTYEYVDSDGRSGISTLRPDGKYANAVAGGEIETGTWARRGTQTCLTPDRGETRCYVFTKASGAGDLVGTMANGSTVRLRQMP